MYMSVYNCAKSVCVCVDVQYCWMDECETGLKCV